MSSSSVDWSSLPPDLLQTIASSLQTLSNYIRFRSVCRSWHAAAQLHHRYLPREFPWLMLHNGRSSSGELRFFNLLTRTHHRISLPEPLHSHSCSGSSSGRLVLMDGSPDITVVNPLTGEITHLPPLTTFPYVANYDPCRVGKEYMMQSPQQFYKLYFMRECFLMKVILAHSSQDHTNEFLAFAVSSMGFNLAYCKHGDQSWRSVDGTWSYHEDAVYLRGKLYLVDKRGSLAICDVSNHDSPPVVEFVSPRQEKHAVKHYLVDAKGELVLFSRGALGHRKYDVHKFDWSAREWIPITSLDDTILFLEEDSAFAIVASQYSGCKEYKIYNAHDYRRWETGMVNVGDQVILSGDYCMASHQFGLLQVYVKYMRNDIHRVNGQKQRKTAQNRQLYPVLISISVFNMRI